MFGTSRIERQKQFVQLVWIPMNDTRNEWKKTGPRRMPCGTPLSNKTDEQNLNFDKAFAVVSLLCGGV